MPDGRARGLPKISQLPARIVGVRQVYSLWNVALTGSMAAPPLIDSVLFAVAFTSNDNWMPARPYSPGSMFGGFLMVPISQYCSSESLQLFIIRRLPGYDFIPNASFNFLEPAASFRGCIIAECRVADVVGVVAGTSATDTTAVTAGVAISAPDGLGGIGVFGHDVNIGGSGPSFQSTTSPELVGSWSSGTGQLTLTNEPHRRAGPWSSSVTCTRGSSIHWSGCSALVR